MSINVEERYQASIVRIKGKFLGSIQGPEFKELIEDLKSEGKLQVVVDLGKTTFIDSSGVGTLIAALTTLRNAGGDLRLARTHDRVHGVFVMTRLLGSAFAHFDTVEEALNSFKEQPEQASTS